MSYLLLNFTEHLDKTNVRPKEYFKKSLKEQYEDLQKKLTTNAPESLQEFIQGVFDNYNEGTYYISLPSFDRSANADEDKYINNVIIRPEKNEIGRAYIRDKYDFILIGDIRNSGKVNDFSVKGMDLIDSATIKNGEYPQRCYAETAFETTTFQSKGTYITVAKYSREGKENSVFTNDFVLYLTQNLFLVKDHQKVDSTLQQWDKYIDWREYYLKAQTNRNYELKNYNVVTAYSVSKKLYLKNTQYKKYLLNRNEEFENYDPVLLSEKVGDAEETPLIQIHLSKNRKAVLLEEKENPKDNFENTLRRFSKSMVALSPTAVDTEENSNYTRSYVLGERAAFVKHDELPDFTELEKEYNQKIKNQFTLIENKYGEKLKEDLKKFQEETRFNLEQKSTRDIIAFNNELNARLDSDVIENKDDEILKQIANIVQEDKTVREFKNQIKTLEEKASKLQNVQGVKDIDDLIKGIPHIADDAEVRDLEDKIKKLQPVSDNKNSSKKNKKNNKKNNNNNTNKNDLELKNLINSLKEIIETKLIRELKKLKDNLEDAENHAQENIDIRNLYIERNKKESERKEKQNKIRLSTEVDNLTKQKEIELKDYYKSKIKKEQDSEKAIFEEQLEKEKKKKEEEETVRHYNIFYHPDNPEDNESEMEKDIQKVLKNSKTTYLIYDDRAEKAKVNRQKISLDNIKKGYVKNPYLASYLFEPESLKSSKEFEEDKPAWYTKTLNDSQKEAVRKALVSDSIFLLQGPPGTGKTEVIAELTAQFASRGKKVLISSETHKAIENVFERLPKTPNIRPLRLIPSRNGKNNDYSIEKLIDNFYTNIKESLNKEVKKYNNYTSLKEKFEEKIKVLKFKQSKLLENQNEIENIKAEIKELEERKNSLQEKTEINRACIKELNETLELYRRTKTNIENNNFNSDGAKEKYLNEFKLQVGILLSKYNSLKGCEAEQLPYILSETPEELRETVNSILSNSNQVEKEEERKRIKEQMDNLCDPITADPPKEGEENFETYREIRKKYIALGNELKAIKEIDFSDCKLLKFLKMEDLKNQDLLNSLPTDISLFSKDIFNLKELLKEKIDEDKEDKENEKSRFENSNIKLSKEIKELGDRISDLREDNVYQEYERNKINLTNEITDFFRENDIAEEYEKGDFDAAIRIMKREWNKLDRTYSAQGSNRKDMIAMYDDISKYLSNKDILEDDRKQYTKELYNNVNVVGITCTSRDNFTSKKLEELSTYGIDEIDIKELGIDVVIIDEVSKSAFLDLLIPILYGKTVILVGDHRQLPPMYDLKHMKDSDFEDLDEDKITKIENDKYTDLYEECFFKTLFEKVPDEFRIMLNKQYRFHSDIMKVVNEFYGGNIDGLKVGKKQLDDEKQHNLNVTINGKNIIEPDRHVYFIDCEGHESAERASTSKKNEQEASVVLELLERMDAEAQNSSTVYGKSNMKSELSIGVICTYAEQARLIKNKRGKKKYNGFSNKSGERLIISTVDNFQGDERDIIIVSMVRNPKGGMGSSEFIKQFERINVAFSRARKLLIIVGSKDYLSRQRIDIPDISGDISKYKRSYPIYGRIINTISAIGRVWKAEDIIGTGEQR